MVQVRLLPLKDAVPMGAVPTNVTEENADGTWSVTTTPAISRPATGPLPKIRRHTYPSHSSTKQRV